MRSSGFDRVGGDVPPGFGPQARQARVEVGDRAGSVVGVVEVLVAPTADVPRAVAAQERDDRGMTRRQVTAPVGGAQVPAEVLTLESGQTLYQAWFVDDAEGHGAVTVVFEGQPGRSDRASGWGDAAAKRLLSDVLTAPPAGAGRGTEG